ncbi:hypothetical protein EV14_0302 [Prochlorococcus sp. MIT 0703]|nr:hypothetical protein EV12_0617 [Prochlorococcus sp. MIT 0701]KGG36388.1 hypothetical protein EV14_0302 [Prochlorococcus sp. MIT 0703]
MQPSITTVEGSFQIAAVVFLVVQLDKILWRKLCSCSRFSWLAQRDLSIASLMLTL